MERVHLVQIHLVQSRPLGTVHRYRWWDLGSQLHTRGQEVISVTRCTGHRGKEWKWTLLPARVNTSRKGVKAALPWTRTGGLWASGMLRLQCSCLILQERNSCMKRVQAKEDELRKMFGQPRVKIIERAGTALENLLCSKNPWSRMVCGRTSARKGVRAWDSTGKRE